MKELYQSADWKKEKHVPVIETPAQTVKGKPIEVRVSVGKEIPHPNTTGHHIVWIEVFFLARGEKFPVQIARFDFTAHGASLQGPDTSTIYTVPDAVFNFTTEKEGKLMAAAYCNIHGLWEGEKELKINESE